MRTKRVAVILVFIILFMQSVYALHADRLYTPEINAYWRDLINNEEQISPSIFSDRFLYGTYKLTNEQLDVSNSYKQFFIQNLIRTPLKDYWSISDAAKELEPMQILFVGEVRGGLGVTSGNKMVIKFTDNGGGGDLTISKYKSIASHELTHALTWGIVDEKSYILTEGSAVYVEAAICKVSGVNFTMQADHIQAMKQVEAMERLIGAKNFWTLTRAKNGGKRIAAAFEEKQSVVSWVKYKKAGNKAFGDEKEMEKLTGYVEYIENHRVFNPNDPRHVEIRAYMEEDGVSIKFMQGMRALLKNAVQIKKGMI